MLDEQLYVDQLDSKIERFTLRKPTYQIINLKNKD